MKLIKLLVAVIALSLIAMPLARAQETETPTEKATPTPAEKAEAEKSEPEKKSEAEKSPAPEKSAAKSEKPEASPSAKAPTNAAPSEKTAAKGSVDAQLKDMEDRWEMAISKHDTATVEQLIADDYVMTNEKGKVLNRAAALKERKKDTDTYEKATNSKIAVHMINRDAAVVTGMSQETGKDKSGKPFDRTYRWTDTFVVRNGKWQCVATQVTLLAQK